MKKITLALTVTGLAIAPLMALAAFGDITTAPEREVCCGPESIAVSLVNWLFGILLVVAVIFIIIAAYFFVTAQGDPEKTKSARNFVLYAVIGVLVAFAAKGLVMLVGTIAG